MNSYSAPEPILHPESDLCPHRLDVNPEARLFRASGSGATEQEYLQLLSALVAVFKPTHLFETGTLDGDGTLALISAAPPGAQILTVNNQGLPAGGHETLHQAACRMGSELHFHQVHTADLMKGRFSQTWGDLTQGKATFAFLDTSIPSRADEFEYLSDPRNGVLDFTRPVCVCVHDMSRYRHPRDADTGFLAETVRRIESLCQQRGWQALRLHQSRGLLILVKYPDHIAGIDGQCIVQVSVYDRSFATFTSNRAGG